MGSSARRAAAGVVAALMLAVAVTTATAGRIQLSSQQFRATWAPVSFQISAGVMRCNVTLEGSLHSRTLAKVSGALVGHISRASIGSCVGGELRPLPESLPWHVRYSSFSGTLPRISTVRFGIVGFTLWFNHLFGIRCLYRSTAGEPLHGTWRRAEFQEFPEFEIPERITLEGSLLETQGGACLGTIRVEGAGRLTALGATTLVTVTLI